MLKNDSRDTKPQIFNFSLYNTLLLVIMIHCKSMYRLWVYTCIYIHVYFASLHKNLCLLTHIICNTACGMFQVNKRVDYIFSSRFDYLYLDHIWSSLYLKYNQIPHLASFKWNYIRTWNFFHVISQLLFYFQSHSCTEFRVFWQLGFSRKADR